MGAEHLQQLSATGGKPPYTWSVAAGTLPRGLHLNAQTGVITGQPSLPGASTFTVRVVDSDARTAESGFLLTIDRASESRFVLPHITCGGGWKTSLRLLNASPSQIGVSMKFRRDDGSPLPFPLTVTAAARRRELNVDEVTETIDPYSSLEVETARQEGIESPGWAEIVCGGPVTGYASFDYLASSGVTVDSRAGVSACDSGGLRPHREAQDRSGAGQCGPCGACISQCEYLGRTLDSTRPGGTHHSRERPRVILARGQIPGYRAKRGIVEFRAAEGKVAGLGLRFHTDGSFFAIPMLSRPATK